MQKYNGYLALLIEMEKGRKISLVEAQILFGVQSLNRDLTRMKRDGYMIKSQKVPMARVMKRMNEHCVVIPPKE